MFPVLGMVQRSFSRAPLACACSSSSSSSSSRRQPPVCPPHHAATDPGRWRAPVRAGADGGTAPPLSARGVRAARDRVVERHARMPHVKPSRGSPSDPLCPTCIGRGPAPWSPTHRVVGVTPPGREWASRRRRATAFACVQWAPRGQCEAHGPRWREQIEHRGTSATLETAPRGAARCRKGGGERAGSRAWRVVWPGRLLCYACAA